MSTSISIHTKRAVKFKTEGHASCASYGNDIYPVVTMEYGEEKGIVSDSVMLFASIEQLYELRKSITAAIRDTHKQKRAIQSLR